MACYDCEDCNKHTNNGGRCNKFEYNCPYDLVKNTSIDDVKQIQNKLNMIEQLIKDVESLDEEGILWNEISRIKSGLAEMINISSDEVVGRWMELKTDER